MKLCPDCLNKRRVYTGKTWVPCTRCSVPGTGERRKAYQRLNSIGTVRRVIR